MQTHLVQQNSHTSRSLDEWLVQAGVLIWVILGMMTGWLKETGLRLLSTLTVVADESIDSPAEATSDFGHFGGARQQERRI